MARNLLRLNGLAIFCVVLFHSAGWGFTAMFFWAHRYLPVASPDFSQAGSAAYYVLRLIEQLVVFSIPAFLFVSGFFIAFSAGRLRPTVEWKVIGLRIKHLAIPYLLWSTLVIALLIAEGRVTNLLDLPRLYLTGASNPAYYFVPLLIQYYLLSPVLVPLAKKNWKALLIVTGLLQIGVHALQYVALLAPTGSLGQGLAAGLPKWFFPFRLFWFSFGIVVCFHMDEIKPFLLKIRRPLLAVGVILLVAGMVEWESLLRLSGQPWLEMRETLIDALYALVVLLTFLAYAEIPLPASPQLEALAPRSFGIYLVHSPVQELVARGVYHLAPALLGVPLLLTTLVLVLGLAVPLALMWLVNRTPARRWYAYQFG